METRQLPSNIINFPPLQQLHRETTSSTQKFWIISEEKYNSRNRKLTFQLDLVIIKIDNLKSQK